MPESELLTFFKALADANRLKIIGLLAQRPHTGEQLAVCLELRPSTISHHLTRLKRAGLVRVHAEGYYSVYQLDIDTLETMARRLLREDMLPVLADGVDPNAFDDKVWRDFTKQDGRLKTIPSQRKKRLIILRRMLQDIVLGRRYAEQEINTLLRRYHDDTATLRREMIAAGLLERENGIYWRPDPEEPSTWA